MVHHINWINFLLGIAVLGLPIFLSLYFDIVFFSQPIAGFEHRFISRSATPSLFFIALAVLDYQYWDKLVSKMKFQAAEKQFFDHRTGYRLSVHFIQNLLTIVRTNGLKRKDDIYNFFDYIYLNLVQRSNKVSLEKEWNNVKLLIYICSHRNYQINGEEALDVYDWNLSVPALCVLTWMENAIQYSPSDPAALIKLTWQVCADGISLSIVNTIAAAQGKRRLSGNGLELVNTLLHDDGYGVYYGVNAHGEFELTFIIK